MCLVCLPWLRSLGLYVDVDIYNSIFTADTNCTQEQFVDKTLDVGNFDDLKDWSSNEASSVTACIIWCVVDRAS